jgi:hypothetical protein
MGKALAKIFLKKTKVSLGEEHCIVRKVPFSHDTGRAKPLQIFSGEKTETLIKPPSFELLILRLR